MKPSVRDLWNLGMENMLSNDFALRHDSSLSVCQLGYVFASDTSQPFDFVIEFDGNVDVEASHSQRERVQSCG